MFVQAVVGFATLSEEYGIHDNHIVLSDELRRQMGVEVTSKVLLRSLSADRQPLVPSQLTLHPLFSMVSMNYALLNVLHKL